MLKYKIVLAGAKDTGKSSLIARFCDNIFDEKTMDTIGVAFKRKRLTIDGKIELDLNIWDFGGEEKYRDLFPSYVHGTSGALILYDLTRKETLDDIDNWVNIIDSNQEDVVKMIIGTKSDLKDQRQIPREVANECGEKYNCCGEPLETSSKTGVNVEAAFLRLSREIMRRKVRECKGCGEIYDKKLKYCNYCGEKAEIEAV